MRPAAAAALVARGWSRERFAEHENGVPDVWNRAPGRTRDDVIAAFDRAIALCEDASVRPEPIDPAAA